MADGGLTVDGCVSLGQGTESGVKVKMAFTF